MSKTAMFAAPDAHLNALLPHVDHVGDECVEAQVDAVLRVIHDAGLAEVLSVERAHKHYELHGDEAVVIVVERAGPGAGGSATVRIVPMAYDADSMFPVSFVGHAAHGLLSTVWMLRSEATALVEAKLEALRGAQPEALAAVERALLEHPALGVAVRIDGLFCVEPGQIVMERTYEDRSQTLTVERGPLPAQAIETSWLATATEHGGPWTRACSRGCEWGPFKGHVTYHRSD